MSTLTGRTGLGERSRDTATLTLTLSRAVLAALAAGFGVGHLAGVEMPWRAQLVVYLVGMVALNLPHGGYEHFDNLRRRGFDFQWRYVARYLGLIAAFVGLLLLAPVAGLALALAVAVTKGGHGGLKVLDATTGTAHLRTRVQRLLAVVVRGGAVMLVPVVVWPGTFHTFSAYMVNIFDPGALASVSGLFPATRTAVAVGYPVAVLAHLGLGAVRRDGGGSWLVDAGETLLLVTYFAVVPVVVAVGLYFPFWYSTRQVARAAAVDGGDEESGLYGFTRPRLVALAAWGTLVAGALATFGLLAVVYVLAPNPLGGAPPLAGAVAFWSVFISVVALPHVAVGSWLDRDRGIWYVP
jgi:Brp/Blh family beta-carotene 15,15'-monooxygenase